MGGVIFHKELIASGRWFRLNLMEQMANIGCDVDRAIRWKNRGDIQTATLALYRALELIDLTLKDPKIKTFRGRKRELLRIRGTLVDYILYDNQYGSTDERWYNYFYHFNYAAALYKGK